MLLLLAACEKPGPWLDADLPAISGERVALSPGVMDFGEVSATVFDKVESTFTVTNLGEDLVTLTGQDEPIGDERFVVEAAPIETLNPGETRSFAVYFSPQTDETVSAQLRIDPGGELLQLRGVGRAPIVELEGVETPATVLGCASNGHATVANHGSETLEITDVRIEGPDFQLTGWQSTVAAGETMAIEFSFLPLGGGQRGATLSLESNDPRTPEVAMNFGALGYEGSRVEESFRYSPTAPTDILFVVEGGVEAEATQLSEALDAYVRVLRGSNIDFQVSAVASNSPCPPDSPMWSTPSSTSLATINVLARAFNQSGGAWDHDLLGLGLAALAESGAGACLDGFRREGANLDVVLVGLSPPSFDVPLAASRIANTLGANEDFRLSAMVPFSGSCGSAGAAYAAVTADYGGVAADWCDDDWIESFATFAQLPNSDAAVSYLLSDIPVEQTISVSVEGNSWTAWTFDANTNTVFFDSAITPALGAEVTIAYVAAVSCTP